MGDTRPDNGAGWPPDDGSGGLPDLPPEWGSIVIPDDAAELDAEARAIRRELRREARWGRIPQRLRRPIRWTRARHRHEQLTVVGPMLIMAVAVLTTLVSLFVVTWDRAGTGPTPSRITTGTATTGARTGGAPATGQVTPTAAQRDVADLVLRDRSGDSIRLGTALPAIIVLVDACRCPSLVVEVAARTPAGVRVLAVDRAAPVITEAPGTVMALADPQSLLRSRYPARAAPTGGRSPATALTVDRRGRVLAVDEITVAADLTPVDPALLA